MNINMLIVVYDFPPEVAGGGVMRTVKLLKYLRTSSINPFVLTVQRNISLSFVDESLDASVSNFEITRAKDILFSKAGGFIQTIRKNPTASIKNEVILFLRRKFKIIENLLIPDKNAGWIIPAVAKGIKLVKKNKINIVYATGPPFSSFIAGYIISRLTGKMLAIDYRDAWNGNPLFDSDWRLKNILCRKLEKIVLHRADYAIFTTPNIKNSTIYNSNIQPKRSKIVWNGYDQADFPTDYKTINRNNKLNIRYLGGVGGINEERSPKKLLDAFGKLDTGYRAELEFIGFVPNDVKEYVLNNSIKNVSFVSAVDHLSAIKYMLDSDILIVLLPIEQDGLNCVPGKTFEYMRSQRPILAITPLKGQLAQLIRDYNAGIVVDSESGDKIYYELKSLIEKVKSNHSFYNARDVKYFNRNNQYQILENYLLSTFK